MVFLLKQPKLTQTIHLTISLQIIIGKSNRVVCPEEVLEMRDIKSKTWILDNPELGELFCCWRIIECKDIGLPKDRSSLSISNEIVKKRVRKQLMVHFDEGQLQKLQAAQGSSLPTMMEAFGDITVMTNKGSSNDGAVF